MLLVKKCNFFLYLFSLKVSLEIMFNNVLDRKETFFGHKNFNLSKSQKSHFSKGVNPCFWSKNVNSSFWFSLKIRLETMFNNVLDREETFFGHKNFSLSKSQKSHFSKGVIAWFWPKNVLFLFLFSVKIRLQIMFNNVLDRKETFFGHKNFNISKPWKSLFSKGVNPWVWPKNAICFCICFRLK